MHEVQIFVPLKVNKGKPMNIPYWMAWCMAKVGDLLGQHVPINSYKLEKMTKSLTFSNEKARREQGWEPMDVLESYEIRLVISDKRFFFEHEFSQINTNFSENIRF